MVLDTSEGAELLLGQAPPVAVLTRTVVATLEALRPDFIPKVQLGWRSVNFRHKRAGFICAVFPMPDHVAIIFENGRLLSSTLLEGEGKRVRFIRLNPGEDVPEDEIGLLLAEAVALKA